MISFSRSFSSPIFAHTNPKTGQKPKQQALQFLFTNLDSDSHYIWASDVNKKGAKGFFAATCEQVYASLNRGNCSFYECTRQGYPITFMVDLDCRNMEESGDDLVNSAIRLVLAGLRSRHQIRSQRSRVVVLQADHDQKQPKLSYHLIFLDAIFADPYHAKSFNTYLISQYGNETAMRYWDHTIYREGVFRTYLSAKMGSPRVFRCCKLHGTYTIDDAGSEYGFFLASLATHVDPAITPLVDTEFQNTTAKIQRKITASPSIKTIDNPTEKLVSDLLNKILNRQSKWRLSCKDHSTFYANQVNNGACLVHEGTVHQSLTSGYVKITGTIDHLIRIQLGCFACHDHHTPVEHAIRLFKPTNDNDPWLVELYHTLFNPKQTTFIPVQPALGTASPPSYSNVRYMTSTHSFVQDLRAFSMTPTLFLKCPQGTGKSTAVAKYLASTNVSSLILSCRISLGCTIEQKLQELTYPVANYLNLQCDQYKEQRRLIITAESLPHFLSTQTNTIDYRPTDVLWLDETSQLRQSFSSPTMNGKRKLCYGVFSYLVRTAKQVICTDADLTQTDIDWINQLRPKRAATLLHHINKTDPNQYYFLQRDQDMRTKIMASLTINKRVVIGADSVKDVRVLYTVLREAFPGKKLLLITGEDYEVTHDVPGIDRNKTPRETIIRECNQLWQQFDVIIYSPCVVFGVDFNVKNHFHEMYYFYNGVILPKSVNQALHRCRSLIDQNIHITIKQPNRRRSLPTDLDAVRSSLHECIADWSQHQRVPQRTKQEIQEALQPGWNNQGKPVFDLTDSFTSTLLWNICDSNVALNDPKNALIHAIASNLQDGSIQIQLPECMNSIASRSQESKEDRNDEQKQAIKKAKELRKEQVIDRLLQARELTEGEYERMKRKRGGRTNGDGNALRRHYLVKHLYGFNDSPQRQDITQMLKHEKRFQSWIRYLLHPSALYLSAADRTDVTGVFLHKYELLDELFRLVGFAKGQSSSNSITSIQFGFDSQEFNRLYRQLLTCLSSEEKGQLGSYRTLDTDSHPVCLNRLIKIADGMRLGAIQKAEVGRTAKERRYQYRLQALPLSLAQLLIKKITRFGALTEKDHWDLCKIKSMAQFLHAAQPKKKQEVAQFQQLATSLQRWIEELDQCLLIDDNEIER